MRDRDRDEYLLQPFARSFGRYISRFIQFMEKPINLSAFICVYLWTLTLYYLEIFYNYSQINELH